VTDGPAFPSFDLEKKAALVTGASRGIGRDTARALANAGASVAVAARDLEALESVAEEITAAGGEAHAIELDLLDVDSIERGVASAVERLGRIDILVNNAGIGAERPALEVTEEQWDWTIGVNLKGLFFCSQAAARRMADQRYGRIVNMGSQAGRIGIREQSVYCASKAAIEGLTRVLALEWAPYNVTVNVVAPTFIWTPGTAPFLDDPEYLESVVARIPLGRVGSTMEVAAAVIYLASPGADLVTGSVVTVDGGWTAQ
jgi:NAD(P)-dependent dehydrogenase (short-subunit alcohol dehydrogenase family)